MTYHDEVCDTVSEYILAFWARDATLSLFDTKRKRVFLRRSLPAEGTKLEALTLGATVVVNGRALKVVDYADAATRRKLGALRGAVLVLVKPAAFRDALGDVLAALAPPGSPLRVGRARSLRFADADDAAAFLRHSAGGREVDAAAASHLASGPCLALELVGDDALAAVHALVGPADPADARAAAPGSVRAVYGRDRARNAVHASATAAAAAAELADAFSPARPPTAAFSRCAAVLVKPHAVAAGLAPAVLRALAGARLRVTAVRALVLTRSDAADFFAHYRGVAREFEQWVVEASSGTAWALEVQPEALGGEDDAAADGAAAVAAARDVAGPYDPVVARALRPASLRGAHGVDAVYNALHVTDLPRDGPLESKFLFVVS